MKIILRAMLTLLLLLTFCASASAAAYTHPSAGFQLTIPEGWLTVDSTNVEQLINSDQVSAGMVTTLASIRPILDSTSSVFLFQEDAAQPPYVNVAVEYKGEMEAEITVEDLLATAQAYEAYYLDDQEQFPGYTVVTPAGAEPVEGWYSMGYLGGMYEKSGYRIALTQIFVAADTRFYEFTLTADEDSASTAYTDFVEFIGSFVAP